MITKNHSNLNTPNPAKLEIEQKLSKLESGTLMLEPFKPLQLYNVQLRTGSRTFNQFIYALDRDDAIELMTGRFKEFEFSAENIYCQRVDPVRGMTFLR